MECSNYKQSYKLFLKGCKQNIHIVYKTMKLYSIYTFQLQTADIITYHGGIVSNLEVPVILPGLHLTSKVGQSTTDSL